MRRPILELPLLPIGITQETRERRAEPVAALYEQGRVTHCGELRELEEELMALGSAEARGSFDRPTRWSGR